MCVLVGVWVDIFVMIISFSLSLSVCVYHVRIVHRQGALRYQLLSTSSASRTPGPWRPPPSDVSFGVLQMRLLEDFTNGSPPQDTLNKVQRKQTVFLKHHWHQSPRHVYHESFTIEQNGVS